AGSRRNNAGSSVECVAFWAEGARDFRVHLVRIRSNAFAPGPDRGVPAVSLRASLSRLYARKLDGGRSYGHHWRSGHLLRPCTADDSAAGALDVGIGRFRRRGFVLGERCSTRLGSLWEEDPNSGGSHALGPGYFQSDHEA